MADPHFFIQPKPLTVKEVASVTGADIVGDADYILYDVAPLQIAQSGHLSFLDNAKYADAFIDSKAGACIVSPDMKDSAPKGMTLLVAEKPYKAYAQAAAMFYPEPSWSKSHVSDNAIIHDTAIIGSKCVIAPGVYIGRNVKIGHHCWIKPNAVIGDNVTIGDHTVVGASSSLSYCHIGHHVRILAGARIGQEGFGFHMDADGPVTVPQLGRVLIGDHVMIGANTTIDRGAGPDTVIGDGTMIDNLVQVAHNVQIGRCCIIVAQVGISGSTKIGDFSVLAGQVGVAGHLTIGNGVRIGAQSGVMRNVPDGAELMGSPAVPTKQFFKQIAKLSRLAKQVTEERSKENE